MVFIITRSWTSTMTGEKRKETVHYGWKGRTARSALINFLAEVEGIEAKNVEHSIDYGYRNSRTVVGISHYVATETSNQFI